MEPERHSTRRRFVTLASGLGITALAGCMDGQNGGGEGNETDGEGDDNGSTPEARNEPPNVEGTNLFVRVVDGEGAAIEGATVTITGGTLDGEEFETDPDGRVIRRNVEPGEYTVVAAVDEREDGEEITIETDDDATLTFEFPAPSDENENGNGSENGTESEGEGAENGG